MNNKIRLIGVSGQLGSGKDTVAEHLIEEHGFTRVALADPIKRFGYHVFLFNEKQLWGPSGFRNSIDSRYETSASFAWDSALGRLEAFGRTYCTDVLGTDDRDQVEAAYKELVHWFFWLRTTHGESLSPRVMLQTLGTEWGRERISSDIWMKYTLRTAKSLLHLDGSTRAWEYCPLKGISPASGGVDTGVNGVVISDVRFENEFRAIRSAGGAVIRVIRPDTDEEAATVGIAGHASEAQNFSFDNFDFIINNDKSLRELYENVDQYMEIFNVAHK